MSMSVQKSKRAMHVKMITFGILLHAVASITEDSLITCDEFINDEDSVLTNISTNLSTNVTSNVSINVLNKKVKYKMGYGKLCSACSFISDHINLYSCCYLLSLCKA